jgi:hypothetical protein
VDASGEPVAAGVVDGKEKSKSSNMCDVVRYLLAGCCAGFG